jgi:hypothetical protein
MRNRQQKNSEGLATGRPIDKKVARLVIILVSLSLGCWEPRTVKEVQGRYKLKKQEAIVYLSLKEDMTYEEAIHFPSGEVITITGKWDYNYGFVMMDGAANLSKKLEPDNIERIDTGPAAEVWFGEHRIDINPNEELYFYKDR